MYMTKNMGLSLVIAAIITAIEVVGATGATASVGAAVAAASTAIAGEVIVGTAVSAVIAGATGGDLFQDIEDSYKVITDPIENGRKMIKFIKAVPPAPKLNQRQRRSLNETDRAKLHQYEMLRKLLRESNNTLIHHRYIGDKPTAFSINRYRIILRKVELKKRQLQALFERKAYTQMRRLLETFKRDQPKAELDGPTLDYEQIETLLSAFESKLPKKAARKFDTVMRKKIASQHLFPMNQERLSLAGEVVEP